MDAFLKIARKDPQSMYQTIPITGNTLIWPLCADWYIQYIDMD